MSIEASKAVKTWLPQTESAELERYLAIPAMLFGNPVSFFTSARIWQGVARCRMREPSQKGHPPKGKSQNGWVKPTEYSRAGTLHWFPHGRIVASPPSALQTASVCHPGMRQFGRKVIPRGNTNAAVLSHLVTTVNRTRFVRHLTCKLRATQNPPTVRLLTVPPTRGGSTSTAAGEFPEIPVRQQRKVKQRKVKQKPLSTERPPELRISGC